MLCTKMPDFQNSTTSIKMVVLTLKIWFCSLCCREKKNPQHFPAILFESLSSAELGCSRNDENGSSRLMGARLRVPMPISHALEVPIMQDCRGSTEKCPSERIEIWLGHGGEREQTVPKYLFCAVSERPASPRRRPGLVRLGDARAVEIVLRIVEDKREREDFKSFIRSRRRMRGLASTLLKRGVCSTLCLCRDILGLWYCSAVQCSASQQSMSGVRKMLYVSSKVFFFGGGEGKSSSDSPLVPSRDTLAILLCQYLPRQSDEEKFVQTDRRTRTLWTATLSCYCTVRSIYSVLSFQSVSLGSLESWRLPTCEVKEKRRCRSMRIMSISNLG